jgi:hypothetical protein
MLYQLLLPTDQAAAEYYLTRGFKLIEDTLRECWASDATLKDGKVDFGKDGWEPILAVSPLTSQLCQGMIADQGSIRRSTGMRGLQGAFWIMG